MTLPALTLDDLTYEDLRALAMRSIPAASGGRWTHHAPVDAGVTLLELFAFLLEQELFVLDQVPDTMVRALLTLLGEAARPTRVARTLFVAQGGGEDFVALDQGAAFRPVGTGLDELVFSIAEAALLPPVETLGVAIDGEDAGSALAQGRSISLMTGLGAPGRLDLDVRLATAFRAEHVGRALSLALVLDGTGVAPEWAEAAVPVPPPGPFTLRWEGGGAGGDVKLLGDGTGGLRRSGLIRFEVPAGFAGCDAVRLTLATERVTHAEAPRLSAVHLGAVFAHHRHARTVGPNAADDPNWEALAAALADWLPNSGQVLDLPPALAPVIEDTVALRLIDREGDWQDWTPVADLATLSPEDRGFAVDRGFGRLAFGDGYTGRVPAPAADLMLQVELGGGSAGNHAAGMAWRGLDDALAGVKLLSAVDAIDGAEAESVADARARVASSLAERHRAVTAGDYVHLVETAPGLGPHRAQVVEGYDPHFPCRYVSDSVTVFIVPRTTLAVAAPRADEGALAAIRARLDEARMLTTRLFVVRPLFRPVALEIQLRAGSGDAAAFGALLRPVFAAYLHPAAGGPDGAGWPFGRALRPSELIRVAQGRVKDDVDVERVSIRLEDVEGPDESCTDVAIGENDLVFLSSFRVRVAASIDGGTTL